MLALLLLNGGDGGVSGSIVPILILNRLKERGALVVVFR